MHKTTSLRLLSALILVASVPSPRLRAQSIDPAASRPPVARAIPREILLHGDRRVDPYFWLRERSNPEVVAYLDAENAYTEAVMGPTVGLQDALYREMVGRVRQADFDVPVRLNDHEYYSRTEEGRQYAILCRRRTEPGAPEEVLLDLNTLAEGQRYLSLGESVVSDDGTLLAYTLDTTGSHDYVLYIKDLRSGELLPDRIREVGRVHWAANNRTLFYVADDTAKRPYRVYRHILGTADDRLVYEEKDEAYRILTHRSRDRKYQFITSLAVNTSEVRFLPSDQSETPPRIIVPREFGHAYHADHRNGLLYVRTDKGPLSPEFRVVTAPVDDPRPGNWKEIVPARPGVRLQRFDLFADYGVVLTWKDGNASLEVLDFADGSLRRLPQEGPVFTATSDPEDNPSYDATTYRFKFESYATPRRVYDCDLKTGALTLRKATEIFGGFDPSRYVEEQIMAVAPDGARVPISLVARKGIPRDGSAPMLLTGYGAYGLAMNPDFRADRLSLLDRGVIYAVAHVRGGGDKGRVWHNEGRLFAKWNTFADFIAAAETLIERKYSSAKGLAIYGRSAGGLLVGAAVNLRPDLFRVAVLDVPFVDVVNSMLDTSLPLTAQEHLEWGNPADKAQYDLLKSYCPYSNLRSGAYPSILVRGSFNDSQVMYWEPAKYVARLRSLKTDTRPLLLRMNMVSGHAGSSGRFDSLRNTAFLNAFILDQLDVGEPRRRAGDRSP